MGQIVNVTNFSDHSGVKPTPADVWRIRLAPGESTRLPVELIDDKVRKLETEKVIHIGPLPSWYEQVKTRKFGKELTAEQIQSRIAAKSKKAEPVKTAMVLSPQPETNVQFDELLDAARESAKKDKKGK